MKLIEKLNSVNFFGNTMFFNPEDTLYFKKDNPRYEPFLTETILSMIHEGDVFVDIGANIGYFTMLASNKLGSKGKVYCFEPDRDNFSVLKKNVESNGYWNVTLVNKAVFNREGKATLYKSGASNTDHSLYKDALIDQKGFEEVDIISLDHYPIGKIDIIKIDAQGAELDILLGMTDILTQDSLIIFMEFWSKGLYKIGKEPQEILDILWKNNFKLYEIREEKRKIVSVKELGSFISNQTNLMAIKGERQDENTEAS